MYKVDLHTHSQGSPDGALRAQDYRAMLESGRLDYIAVTDHDDIEFAKHLHATFGDKIIVGEEISTLEGEVIGLFLKEPVAPGQSAQQTVAQIKKQQALVYIPHPFETVRRGLPLAVLDKIAQNVDIIETCNGRAVFQNRGADAGHWATMHGVPGAASSDAHGKKGWGNTFTTIEDVPDAANLVRLLERATCSEQTVGWRGLVYPKLNRLRRKLS